MPAYVDTGFNVVAVEDVAEGHWLAAQRGRIGQRYILGGRNMTLKEYLDALAPRDGHSGPANSIAACLRAGGGYSGKLLLFDYWSGSLEFLWKAFVWLDTRCLSIVRWLQASWVSMPAMLRMLCRGPQIGTFAITLSASTARKAGLPAESGEILGRTSPAARAIKGNVRWPHRHGYSSTRGR